jgi:hypothetical protein
MNSTEKTATLWTPGTRSHHSDKAEPYVLKLCVLYEDARTREWAQEMHRLARRIAGEEALATTWWSIPTLSEPAVLAGAVSKAMHGDIIAIAIHTNSELPLAFYYWADAWLPHRYQEPGALLALLGLPERSEKSPGRMREFFRAMAHRGGLEFLFDQQRVPDGSTVPIQAESALQDAVSRAVRQTIAYRNGRYRSWRRITRMAA